MIKKCVNCGKEFTPYPGAELIQKYCSKQCKRGFAKKPKELRDMVDPAGIFVDMCMNQPPATAPRKLSTPNVCQPNDTAPPVLKNKKCFHCGKIFRQSFVNEKFCSDECRLQYWQASPLQPHLLRRR